MNSKNIRSLTPACGICMLVLFIFSFNGANAQPVTPVNVTPGTSNTTSPATLPIVNVTRDNSSTFDSLNTLNQTANQTSPNVAVQELNQTGILATPPNQSQVNQTTLSGSSTSSGFQLNEKLLNYTNNAILALNEDNETEIQQNLVQIQDALIKAIGKPVVIIPAPAFGSDSDSD